ncbi:MAG: AAA family ATPase [Promethearchaeota archaeon]|nr:MAG: AAA family ATPase [Candidatus Lokiarchaeota archaeon]
MSDSILKKKIEYIQQNDEFDYLKSLIDSLESGNCIGILLQGPPGTGKTLLSLSLARAYNASYYIIDGSPDLDRRDIEGNWELLKEGTKFNYGPLTLAIKDANEKGIAFIIINEINAIRENEQISLNSLLSENHINLISKGFEKHELDPQSKLIIIGTMNLGVIGINKLQEAFEDRFIITPEISYPQKIKEIDITKQISGCKKQVAEIVVDAARQIRKQAIQDYSISKIFSTRLVINFCMLITSMPLKYLKHNIENVIINKLGTTDEEKRSIAMILDGKMFETKLRDQLISKTTSIMNGKSIVDKESIEQTLVKTRECISDYISKYGHSNAFRYNGRILWKLLDWMWRNNRKILQNYFKLTETLNLHEKYKQQQGKNHIHNGSLTLSYIKWIYQKNVDNLKKFMEEDFPVI